ncbi:MAG: iron-containing alcohol dehydrogenase [Firmicutes bacterium]|nr:iron-containing alcohol dehydrogenase [Bacillota bacterium]
MPPVSIMGVGCLEDIVDYVKLMNFKKELIVTDKVLIQIGLIKKLTDTLDKCGAGYVIYDGIHPNPTVGNVNLGLKMLSDFLRRAVKEGTDIEAREMMTYAEYLGGVAFNNVSLGYVHAMAHQLGGFYDLPHRGCNAILFPAVTEYNAKVVPKRIADIAIVMGKDVTGLSPEAAAQVAIAAIRQLSADVNIPSGLKDLKAFSAKDILTLSVNALKDICGATNPKQATQEEIEAIYKALFKLQYSIFYSANTAVDF